MCGISGILLSRGEVSNDVLVLNNKIMTHRGPDSSGTWISDDKKIGFSQTRLSIVDLDERASQPMILDDGNLVIVFNGEIYNYMSLRKILSGKYNFRTTSDTEVLAYAYREFGIGMFDRIEGMFAFAIYDKKKKQVFIARDFVGQKPFVYAELAEGFFFSSEIPVLLSNTKIGREIDMNSIGVFATGNFSHIPQPYTAFKSVKKMKPGHYMIVKNGKILKYENFFRFHKVPQKKMDEFEFISSISDEMKPRDVTFSSFLSGGNDSSLVCAALRKNNKKRVEAYTLRLGKNDSDFLRSKIVSKTLNLNHHVVDMDPRFFLKSVEEQVRIYGEPYFHLTSVYSDYLLKEVKKRHKVIFTGAGGDEVYYGYNNLDLLIVNAFLKTKKFVPKPILRKMFGKKYDFLYHSTLKDVKAKYYLQNFTEISGMFSKKVNPSSYFEEINSDFFRFADVKNFIDLSYMSGLVTENSHSLTIQGDLVGMKNSVEIRCPFLERRIVQRGFSLKLRDKISLRNPQEGKSVIKKALLRIFPRDFVYAKKVGFGSEISRAEDIVKHNESRIRRKLEALSERKEFDRKFIRAIFSDRGSLIRNFQFVMKLYALEVWFEEFVDRK